VKNNIVYDEIKLSLYAYPHLKDFER